jgi:hypothetical protein
VGAYPIRPALRRTLTPQRIESVCREEFGSAALEQDTVVARYGAIEELRVRSEKSELLVELRMNPQVDAATQGETIRRYNRFLQELTGYTAKERAKRAQKAARESAAPG